ncbi:class I SAM-dependent methyltransferase [Alkalilimnicola sp. S0819]|uniref:class I SAM-dependent methyltransferase n=1 Tax=Alkalilimnicola sp. S0819 TaxID=2613922 RepID=UPI00186AB571|nr:methyltransferase domain-containing protein [Alkalilimnicola sp. S0819]
MQALHDWFHTPLGRLLLDQEQAAVREALRGVYLQRVLQLGHLGAGRPLLADDALRRLYRGVGPQGGVGDLLVDQDELPFQTSSLDAVILVHELDYNPQPHQLLREVNRILAPEGRLLVLGFNPWSLWGLSRYWVQGEDLPAAAQHVSVRRLQDWFSLLGLTPLATERLLFRPPWQNPRLQHWLRVLDRYGPRLLPWAGGAYLCSAQKRLRGVTVLRPKWKKPKLVPGLAQPVPRSALHGSASGNLHRRRLPR